MTSSSSSSRFEASTSLTSRKISSKVERQVKNNENNGFSLPSQFWTPTRIWVALVIFRSINAYSIRTFFQPDEYFQSLEPAWQMAFGKDSGAWITWEWHHQLRSSLHPAFFATIYYLIDKLLKLSVASPHIQGVVLAIVPNLAQACIAASGDYYTWKLAEKIHGSASRSAWVTLGLTVCSPWQWFCSTRTFSNSVETTLTIAALYYWPQSLFGGLQSLPGNQVPGKIPSKAAKLLGLPTFSISIKELRLAILLAATACILRPTNLLIWFSVAMPIATSIFSSRTRLSTKTYSILIRESVLCGLTVLTLSAVSDRLYFEEWTFPPYQWLNFNVSQDLAVFYGRNDWHYYISQGLPLLLTTYLPFALTGLWKSTSLYGNQTSFVLASAVLVTVSTLSIIAHKEVRFIYPLLPLLHVIAGPSFSTFFFGENGASATKFHSTGSSTDVTVKKRSLLSLVFALNVMIAGYTSLVHQKGVLDVLTFLRNDFETVALAGNASTLDHHFQSNEIFVGFLMPCHSTPWRSKLVHPELKAWALSCEPPIHLAARTEERNAYRDEADRFYDDAYRFLSTEVGTRERPWPRYVAGFAGVEEVVRRYVKNEMKGVSVEEKWRGKNSDWHDDSRRVGDVVVWELLSEMDV